MRPDHAPGFDLASRHFSGLSLGIGVKLSRRFRLSFRFTGHFYRRGQFRDSLHSDSYEHIVTAVHDSRLAVLRYVTLLEYHPGWHGFWGGAGFGRARLTVNEAFTWMETEFGVEEMIRQDRRNAFVDDAGVVLAMGWSRPLWRKMQFHATASYLAIEGVGGFTALIGLGLGWF